MMPKLYGMPKHWSYDELLRSYEDETSQDQGQCEGEVAEVRTIETGMGIGKTAMTTWKLAEELPEGS
jgi:hypothetical protein